MRALDLKGRLLMAGHDPVDEKVKGIDYRFYRELLAGKYEKEINEGLDFLAQQKSGVFSKALLKA